MTSIPPDGNPYCRWIIAKDYFDGPISGIAIQAKGDVPIFFCVVGWDTEQWERIFAVSVTSPALAERLQVTLTTLEPKREPFWLPGPQSDTLEVNRTWKEISDTAKRGGVWRLIRSHDLLTAAEEKSLPTSEAAKLAQMVDNETVVALKTSALIDEFLQRLKTDENEI